MGRLCSSIGLNRDDIPSVAQQLAAIPRLMFWIYGDSTDGGTTPDATTLASKAALVALGIPAANIKWEYVVDRNLIVASMSSGSTVEEVTLIVDKDLIVNGVSSGTTIEEVILTFAGGLLEIANLSSDSTIEEIILVANV